MHTITERQFKELREKHGLTQKRLGAILGCKQANIHQMESGRVQPSSEQLEKFASFIHVHPLELIAGLPPEACRVADKIKALSPDRRPVAERLFHSVMEMAEAISLWETRSVK